MKTLRTILLIVPLCTITIAGSVIYTKYQELKQLKEDENNSNSKLLHNKRKI